MTEALIDKIRKLIAHEESARKIGSLDEAAAFAEKIQALLFEHKLSMADIDTTDGARTPVGEEVHYTNSEKRPLRRRCDRWYRMLFSHVAQAHFCESIRTNGTNMIHVVGREEDRAIAIAMFHYLLATMKRLASHERRMRKADRRSVRNFTNSFYRGFVVAVAYRYSEARRNADQTESTALVLVRADDETEGRARELHPGMYDQRPRKLKNRVNAAARLTGWRRGNEVSLSASVLRGTERGQLGE